MDPDPDLTAPASGTSWLLLDDAPLSTQLTPAAEGLPDVAGPDLAPHTLAEPDDAALQSADFGAVPTDLDALTDPAPDADVPPVDAAPEVPAGPWRIDAARILQERPDIQQAYYEAYHVSGAYKTPALWIKLVGGTTAQDYARFWYENHGRFEGYNQGSITAELNISVEKILADRPDVLDAFNSSMRHGHHSKAWVKEVGGDTPEAYAKYWHQQHGRWEGYAQTEHAANESISIDRLIAERPDVVDAYYNAYYNVNVDHKSSAWSDRVGGETLQDYVKYWYANYGRKEGYTQNPNGPAAAPAQPEPSGPAPVAHDPSLDPWNHPALYPDWRPPYAGWTPPDDDFHGADAAQDEMAQAIASVGQSLATDGVL